LSTEFRIPVTPEKELVEQVKQSYGVTTNKTEPVAVSREEFDEFFELPAKSRVASGCRKNMCYWYVEAHGKWIPQSALEEYGFIKKSKDGTLMASKALRSLLRLVVFDSRNTPDVAYTIDGKPMELTEKDVNAIKNAYRDWLYIPLAVSTDEQSWTRVEKYTRIDKDTGEEVHVAEVKFFGNLLKYVIEVTKNRMKIWFTTPSIEASGAVEPLITTISHLLTHRLDFKSKLDFDLKKEVYYKELKDADPSEVVNETISKMLEAVTASNALEHAYKSVAYKFASKIPVIEEARKRYDINVPASLDIGRDDMIDYIINGKIEKKAESKFELPQPRSPEEFADLAVTSRVKLPAKKSILEGCGDNCQWYLNIGDKWIHVSVLAKTKLAYIDRTGITVGASLYPYMKLVVTEEKDGKTYVSKVYDVFGNKLAEYDVDTGSRLYEELEKAKRELLYAVESAVSTDYIEEQKGKVSVGNTHGPPWYITTLPLAIRIDFEEDGSDKVKYISVRIDTMPALYNQLTKHVDAIKEILRKYGLKWNAGAYRGNDMATEKFNNMVNEIVDYLNKNLAELDKIYLDWANSEYKSIESIRQKYGIDVPANEIVREKDMALSLGKLLFATKTAIAKAEQEVSKEAPKEPIVVQAVPQVVEKTVEVAEGGVKPAEAEKAGEKVVVEAVPQVVEKTVEVAGGQVPEATAPQVAPQEEVKQEKIVVQAVPQVVEATAVATREQGVVERAERLEKELEEEARRIEERAKRRIEEAERLLEEYGITKVRLVTFDLPTEYKGAETRYFKEGERVAEMKVFKADPKVFRVLRVRFYEILRKVAYPTTMGWVMKENADPKLVKELDDIIDKLNKLSGGERRIWIVDTYVPRDYMVQQITQYITQLKHSLSDTIRKMESEEVKAKYRRKLQQRANELQATIKTLEALLSELESKK